MTRLRDGLVWLQGTSGTHPVTNHWLNQARQLHPADCAPDTAGQFIGDNVWFPGAAASGWMIPHHPALDPSLLNGFSLMAHATLTTDALGGAQLLSKRLNSTGAGYRIARSSSSSEILGTIGDGTTQVNLTGADVGYNTPFTAAFTWDGLGRVAKLYVNAVNTDTNNTLTGAPADPGRDFWFGRWAESDVVWWGGALFNFACARTTWTDDEVTQLHNDMLSAPSELMVDRLWFDCPDEGVQFDGRRLSFTTWIHGGMRRNTPALAEAQALRAQLLGLEEGQVVPIWWSDDVDVTGQYRLTSTPNVSPVSTYLDQNGTGNYVNVMDVSVSVERLPGSGKRGQIEQHRIGKLRDNSHGLTEADATTTTIAAGLVRSSTVDAAQRFTQMTATGPTTGYFAALNSSPFYADIRADLAVQDSYGGAATIEDLTANPYEVSDELVHVDGPHLVRVSNGIIRFWVSDDFKTLNICRWAADTQWGQTHTLTIEMGKVFGSYTSMSLAGVTPTVTREDRLGVGVKYPIATHTGWDLGVLLRRGSSVAELHFAGPSSHFLSATLDGGAASQAIASKYNSCIQSAASDTQGRVAAAMNARNTAAAATDGTMLATPAAGQSKNILIGLGLGNNGLRQAETWFTSERFTERPSW